MKIEKIAYALGSVSEEIEAIKEDNPEWDIDELVAVTGIRLRHICAADESALTLAERAGKDLLDEVDAKDIDGLIYVTQSPEATIPTSACILHQRLGLPRDCLTFDLNQGCSGFTYGLSVASAMITAGALNNCLIVCSETYNQYVDKHDRACRPVFSDGATATFLRGDGEGEIGPYVFATDGSGAPNLMLTPHPLIENAAATGRDGMPRIYMNGAKVLHFTMLSVPKYTRLLLDKAGLTLDDIDLFVFHQASKVVLDNIQRILKIDDDRMVRHYDQIGNTVSSTVPIAYEEVRRRGRVRPGMAIVMMGFGVGFSLSGCLVRT